MTESSTDPAKLHMDAELLVCAFKEAEMLALLQGSRGFLLLFTWTKRDQMVVEAGEL